MIIERTMHKTLYAYYLFAFLFAYFLHGYYLFWLLFIFFIWLLFILTLE